MIQRTLLRQCRAAGSVARSVPRSSLLRAQFQASNVAITNFSRQATAARWYATEPESKSADAAASESGSEDPLKKELDAKAKEIVDLKVCDYFVTLFVSYDFVCRGQGD
jgi:hypothetical protein